MSASVASTVFIRVPAGVFSGKVTVSGKLPEKDGLFPALKYTMIINYLSQIFHFANFIVSDAIKSVIHQIMLNKLLNGIM